MAKGERLSDKQKQERLRALNYEWNMLRATGMALSSGTIEDRLTLNVFLESFLIHARSLIGFLFGPHKQDDLRPGDWLNPNEWRRIRGERSVLLEETYEDAHKYLAHLTATRLTQKRTWDYPAILKEIDTLLDKFLQQVQAVQGKENGS